MTLDDQLPDVYNTDRYQAAITNLRKAAGHIYRDDIYETMGSRSLAGIIVLQLNDVNGDALCWLYLNPQNLYISGFRTRDARSYVFSDTPAHVVDEVQRHNGGLSPGVLGMAGTYSNLRGWVAAEPTKSDIYSIRSHAYFLGDAHPSNTDDNPIIALAMFEFMSAFSEGARFPHYRDEFSQALDGSSNHIYLDSEALKLRSSWQDLSNYAHAITENPSIPPRYISGLGTTLYGWQDVRRYVRSIKGKDS
ncbi:ribosome-inactivating family protein [Streptomyces longwoodensis]|uniref:ribosome-inactivating family protein n=1 Tax=Streptomyces longwoodensis TaxID=68231 RepID=UPI0033FF043B